MNKIIHIEKEIEPITNCKVFKTGLILKEGLDFKDWQKIGGALKTFYKANKWWIGDWILYGERKYGEMYSQALGNTDYEYDTLKDIKYVSSRVEMSCRHDNLSFSHHKEVAGLEPKEQDKWLAKAEEEGWDREEFRRQLRNRKNEELLPNKTKILPSKIKLLEGDIFDKIKDIKDHSIDLLITDPPYLVMNDYEWDKKDLSFLDNWIRLIKPKLKDNYSGFIFCDSRFQFEFEAIIRNNFDIKNRLIWIRKNMSLGRVIKDRFISSYEVIFFFGNKELNFPTEWGEERFDSFEYAVPQSNFKEGKFHPTQKPLELFKRLIKLGSKEGELVADIFAGSGTAGLACKELNRNCVMIEKEKEYINIIRSRI